MPSHVPPAGEVPNFRLADNSIVELFDDCALLFSEREQQLSRLNETSRGLVPLLQRGTTFSELSAELNSRGVPAAVAEEWVRTLLDQLAALSLLDVSSHRRIRSWHTQLVQLGSLSVSLSYGTDELKAALSPVFTNLERKPATAHFSFTIVDIGEGFVEIAEDGRHFGNAVQREMAAIRLKALLVERLLVQGSHLAALHAAFLSHADNHGLLLLGSPGAGKSTLTLALLASGYRYGSDDISLLNADGSIDGVPFAPGVKESGWAIAEKLGVPIGGLPEHSRPDGRRLRFVSLGAECLIRSGSVKTIVKLRRSPQSVTEMVPMRSDEALYELFRESRARDGNCSVEAMSALATLVRGANCFHLDYSEAQEAADEISACVRRG